MAGKDRTETAILRSRVKLGWHWVELHHGSVLANASFTQDTGSRWLSTCIVGLFWGTHFQHGGKFVPRTVPQCTLTTTSTRWRIGYYELHRKPGSKYVPQNNPIVQFSTQNRHKITCKFKIAYNRTRWTNIDPENYFFEFVELQLTSDKEPHNKLCLPLCSQV